MDDELDELDTEDDELDELNTEDDELDELDTEDDVLSVQFVQFIVLSVQFVQFIVQFHLLLCSICVFSFQSSGSINRRQSGFVCMVWLHKVYLIPFIKFIFV
jgi:hypothetical protein